MREPKKPSEIQERPWSKIEVNLYEIKEHHYLVSLDYYSKWSERAKRDMLSSGGSYLHEKGVFKRCGVPVEKVSDNGSQFHSQEFEKFKEDNRFILLASSPHFAQSND